MFPPISGEVANYYYSVRLCRREGSLTQQVTFAFFCVSLCQSAHIKVCHVDIITVQRVIFTREIFLLNSSAATSSEI